MSNEDFLKECGAVFSKPIPKDKEIPKDFFLVGPQRVQLLKLKRSAHLQINALDGHVWISIEDEKGPIECGFLEKGYYVRSGVLYPRKAGTIVNAISNSNKQVKVTIEEDFCNE